MIETEERGDELIAELIESVETGDWGEWELGFIQNLKHMVFKGRGYIHLNAKQCAVVTRMHSKLIKGY